MQQFMLWIVASRWTLESVSLDFTKLFEKFFAVNNFFPTIGIFHN